MVLEEMAIHLEENIVWVYLKSYPKVLDGVHV